MKWAALRSRAVWTWLALMVLGLLLAWRTTYVADLSAFLPEAPTGEQRVLMEQLKRGGTARVMLIGLRGADPALRAEASRSLAAALRAGAEFEAVHNGDQSAWQDAGQRLLDHRYLLSPAVDAQRFSVEGLREGMAETVSLLGTPAGTMIKPLLWRDPTGETVRMAEAMMPAQAPRIEAGVWASRTEPRALLVATTRAEGADLDGQARAIAAIREAAAPWVARGLALELSGPGVMGVDSRRQVQSEVERLAAADTVAMVVLLLLAFGSLKSVGIALLPVASGVLAGIAAVSLGFGEVHGITLGFGTTLIGEAVDYAIYYLIQARPVGTGGPAGKGHLQWREQSWPTVRLGLWTSMAGFAALVFSGFAGLAQLGLFSLAGLAAAAATTRFLLPRLAPDGAPGLGLRRPLGRAVARAAAVLPRLRWVLTFVCAGALLVLAAQPDAWRGTLASLSPVPAAALQLDASLRADLGASEAGTLVAIEAPDEAGVLQRAEQAGARLDPLVEQGRLLGYESPARLLPSPATQAARRAALPDAETLRRRLAEAAEGGPLPAERLAPFIADVQAQRSAPLLTRASLAGTPLASALQAQLLPGHDGGPWTALMSLQLPPRGAIDPAGLRQALDGLPGTRVVQIQAELDGLYRHYLQEALWQALLGGAAVLVLLGLHLRSLRRLLRLALPLAASVVLVLAAQSAAGAPLGVLHLVGLLLVVAVGSNYALFFDHLRQHGEADDETLASLLMANLTTVVSFGLLATSEVPALAAIGQVVAPGALLALLLAAAFIAPSGGMAGGGRMGQLTG
ncbi:MMPL family transporter [Aquabacterium sp. A7-Y]|uniref:MMPL family transporter n=1 Tax=Aquabacterium sp. A7-Y TaxID=1349605 RepID=UPI00223E4D6E|nr:MMPL family transporter [Aquabacterium sp. A7-Y]MCW7536446.1 MMPL family transporter [Aquabacterium sp. A7-Y]